MTKNIITGYSKITPTQTSKEWLEDVLLKKLTEQTHHTYKVKSCNISKNQREAKACVEELEADGTRIGHIVIDLQKDSQDTFVTIMGLNDSPQLIGDILANIQE